MDQGVTELRSVRVGSPSWLQIVRDALLSLAALVFLLLVVVGSLLAGRVADSLSSDPSPSPIPACYIPGDPSCVQPTG